MLEKRGYVKTRTTKDRTFYLVGRYNGERLWYQILEFDFTAKPLIHATPLRFVAGYNGVFLSRQHEVEGKLLRRGRLFDSVVQAEVYLSKYLKHAKTN